MADDKVVVFQSKMMQAFLRAFGVTPTPDGLFAALPPHVQAALTQAVEQAPNVAETVKALHENLPAIVNTIADTHRMQVENNAMLRRLCEAHKISPPITVTMQLAPDLAQEVAEAAIAEASGRS